MQEQQKPRPNSIRTAGLYILAVIILVICTIIIRIIFLAFHTSFDGKHQFIISDIKDAKQIDILAFSPDADDSQKIRILHIHNIHDLNKLSRQMFIPVDASVIDYTTKKDQTIADFTKRLFFHFMTFSPENMNHIDAFHLMLFTAGIKDEDIISRDISFPISDNDEHNLKNFFQDTTVFHEGLSISIINATGRSGVGNSFGKILANIGANVISVDTADAEQEITKIEYSGYGGRTVTRIEKILGVHATKVQNTGFSDIIVTIGKRSLYLPLF